MVRFAEKLKVLPVLAPASTTASGGRGSSYVKLNEAHWISFHVLFGDMTSDSTDGITVKVEASTEGASNATEINVPFSYRLSSAVLGDTMGAITSAAAATGVFVTALDDNKALLIEVDPSVIPSLTGYADHNWVRIFCTPNAELAIGYAVGAMAYIEPRYPGNAIRSTT